MSVELTYYESMYANKKRLAIIIATNLIEVFHKHKPKYNLDSYKMQLIKDMNADMLKDHFDSILHIVDGIMYSSGFFTTHKITTKKKGPLHIVHEIMMMTPEEKETQITSKLDEDVNIPCIECGVNKDTSCEDSCPFRIRNKEK